MTDWSMFRSTHVNSTQNSQVWEWGLASRVFKIEHFQSKIHDFVKNLLFSGKGHSENTKMAE